MNALLGNADISKVLNSSGPVVKCVLLKHMRSDGRDGKPHFQQVKEDDHPHKREVLTEFMKEIEVDTTPSKSKPKEVLGGPITFLGQYEDEGIIVVVRRELPDDLQSKSVATLRDLCKEAGISTTNMVEKSELVAALIDDQLPVNPHKLQPPFDKNVVHGDILLMRVAKTEEVLDGDQDGDNQKEVKVLSNDEFFLDYTLEEYISFASRTDVVAPERPTPVAETAENEEEEDTDEEEESEDEDFDPAEASGEGDDEEVTLEEKQAMLNLLLNQVLKRFRNDNGRGPDSKELLRLRSEVAAQLGLEVATFRDDQEDERKRPAPSDGEPSTKKVKFDAVNGEGEQDDQKAAADVKTIQEDEKPAAVGGDEDNGDKS